MTDEALKTRFTADQIEWMRTCAVGGFDKLQEIVSEETRGPAIQGLMNAQASFVEILTMLTGNAHEVRRPAPETTA